MLMDCAAIENAVNLAKFTKNTETDLKTESTHGAVLFSQLLTQLYLIHLWTEKYSLVEFSAIASSERQNVLPSAFPPTGQDLDRIWNLTHELSLEASGMMLYSMVMEQAALEYQNNDCSKRPLSDITDAERKDGMLNAENLLNLILPRYSALLSDSRILRLAGLSSTDKDKEAAKNIQRSFLTGLHAAVKAYTRDTDNGLATEDERDLFLSEVNSSSHPFQVLEAAFRNADVGSRNHADRDYTFGTGFFYSLLNKTSSKCQPKPAKLQDSDEYLGAMAASVFAFASALPAVCALEDGDYMDKLVRNLDADVDNEGSVYPFDTDSFLLGVKRAVEHLINNGNAHIREDVHFKFVLKWLQEKGLVE